MTLTFHGQAIDAICEATIRFPIDQILLVSLEFFGKTRRLSAIHTLQNTDNRPTTDGRNIVA